MYFPFKIMVFFLFQELFLCYFHWTSILIKQYFVSSVPALFPSKTCIFKYVLSHTVNGIFYIMDNDIISIRIVSIYSFAFSQLHYLIKYFVS